jgi:hypothetical protein
MYVLIQTSSGQFNVSARLEKEKQTNKTTYIIKYHLQLNSVLKLTMYFQTALAADARKTEWQWLKAHLDMDKLSALRAWTQTQNDFRTQGQPLVPL